MQNKTKKTPKFNKIIHFELDVNWKFSFSFASFKERGARYALSQLPKVRNHKFVYFSVVFIIISQIFYSLQFKLLQFASCFNILLIRCAFIPIYTLHDLTGLCETIFKLLWLYSYIVLCTRLFSWILSQGQSCLQNMPSVTLTYELIDEAKFQSILWWWVL